MTRIQIHSPATSEPTLVSTIAEVLAYMASIGANLSSVEVAGKDGIPMVAVFALGEQAEQLAHYVESRREDDE